MLRHYKYICLIKSFFGKDMKSSQKVVSSFAYSLNKQSLLLSIDHFRGSTKAETWHHHAATSFAFSTLILP